MFDENVELQPEMNPIDMLRKYGPYLVGAGACVATIVSLYYVAYGEGKTMVTEGYDGAEKSISESYEVSQSASYGSANDAGITSNTGLNP
jgi:hypothetical protein